LSKKKLLVFEKISKWNSLYCVGHILSFGNWYWKMRFLYTEMKTLL
jgi:hypothetical protein